MKIINSYSVSQFLKINLKLRFIIIGFINVLLTNALLVISINLLPLWLSTFTSQFFNLMFGYFLYSYFVFKVNRISINHFNKYILLAIITWNINFIFIQSMTNLFSLNKRTAALIAIPFLALFSFIIQKKYIFSNKVN